MAEDASLPQLPRTSADILYRAGRYDDALEAYERAAKLAPELGDDLYFKLGNIAYKRREHDERRGRAGSARPSSIRTTRSSAPTSTRWDAAS